MRHSGRGRREQDEEDTGQGIEAQMDWQIRESDRKRERLYRCCQACHGLECEGDAAKGTEGKQRPRDQSHALRAQHRGQSDQAPNTQKGEAGAERGLGRRRHNEGATQVRIGL